MSLNRQALTYVRIKEYIAPDMSLNRQALEFKYSEKGHIEEAYFLKLGWFRFAIHKKAAHGLTKPEQNKFYDQAKLFLVAAIDTGFMPRAYLIDPSGESCYYSLQYKSNVLQYKDFNLVLENSQKILTYSEEAVEAIYGANRMLSIYREATYFLKTDNYINKFPNDVNVLNVENKIKELEKELGRKKKEGETIGDSEAVYGFFYKLLAQHKLGINNDIVNRILSFLSVGDYVRLTQVNKKPIKIASNVNSKVTSTVSSKIASNVNSYFADGWRKTKNGKHNNDTTFHLAQPFQKK